jgi:hypothetical protein
MLVQQQDVRSVGKAITFCEPEDERARRGCRCAQEKTRGKTILCDVAFQDATQMVANYHDDQAYNDYMGPPYSSDTV